MAAIPSIGHLSLKNVCYAYVSGLWPGVLFYSRAFQPALPLAWTLASNDFCLSSPSSHEGLELEGGGGGRIGRLVPQAGWERLCKFSPYPPRMKISYF